jgi:hypothetical protein
LPHGQSPLPPCYSAQGFDKRRIVPVHADEFFRRRVPLIDYDTHGLAFFHCFSSFLMASPEVLPPAQATQYHKGANISIGFSHLFCQRRRIII